MPPYDIPLARPNITQAEIDAVVSVLKTPMLSLGPKLEAFEAAIAEFCGTAEAVACCNGTCALHLLVAAMGIGPGVEVITRLRGSAATCSRSRCQADRSPAGSPR